MRTLRLVLSVLVAVALVRPVMAQSPNTATIVVTVVDQQGGAVKDAKVIVINQATSASRDAPSLGDGSATFAALGLTGSYAVHVEKAGFTAQDVRDLTLRAGAPTRVKVTLVATGGQSTVTVFGSAEGIRQDPQLGTRLDSAQIDQTPAKRRRVVRDRGFR